MSVVVEFPTKTPATGREEARRQAFLDSAARVTALAYATYTDMLAVQPAALALPVATAGAIATLRQIDAAALLSNELSPATRDLVIQALALLYLGYHCSQQGPSDARD